MIETNSNPVAPGKLVKRWLIKTVAFVLFTAVVLSPNLKRTFLQVQHTFHPETLIQTQFAGLSSINAQVDRLVQREAGRQTEARLVAKFVLKKIKYVTDYENWGNVEYWPTAQEAWDRRQEDCDGRAILATSILRSRGFHSARMVVGLDHMWIKVDENEKDPSKPPHVVALLSPNPDFSMDLQESSRWDDLVEIFEALLHPGALIDTATGLFADIPTLRKALLVTALLLLCYHPCRSATGRLAIVAGGLAAVNLLAVWQPGNGHVAEGRLGGFLFLGTLVAALLMGWLLDGRSVPRSEPCLLPESAPAS